MFNSHIHVYHTFQVKHYAYLLSPSSLQSIDLNTGGDIFINQHSHGAYHLIEKNKNIRRGL